MTTSKQNRVLEVVVQHIISKERTFSIKASCSLKAKDNAHQDLRVQSLNTFVHASTEGEPCDEPLLDLVKGDVAEERLVLHQHSATD